MTRFLSGALLALGVILPTHAAPQAEVSTAVDGWDYSLPGEELAQECATVIEQAREDFAAIENDTSEPTVANVYSRVDAMGKGLQRIQYVSYMMAVHPDTEVQAAAQDCIQLYSDFRVGVDLSQKFYRRVAAIDLDSASPAERLMVERRLRDFRRAGVDRDEATREKVRELINEITALGTQFDKNIRTDRRSVEASAAQLQGLPEDYVAAHPADEDGVIRISTDYPDYFPVLQYSDSDDLRRRIFIAAKSIATPANEETLTELLEKRHELARLLGYQSYAAMAMDGLMVGTPQRAASFLAEVGDAVREPAARDMEILLARLREVDPEAQRVEAWQAPWLMNKVRQEQYALDAMEIREYFDFERVQAGIFGLSEDLFGIDIVRWETPTWHEDVTAWEIRENGKPIGRFYLDSHPRENKYSHAAHWTLRTGLRDGQLPLSGMAMNFPRGLMEHNQVDTFLHEFGHLLHNMFSGTQPWLDISGMNMEWDFVEAPSQMLEEWIWDYQTLRRFAVNSEGEPIPAALVEKMRRARHFGEAANTAQQIFYANISLNYYSRDPGSFELLPLMMELQARYSPYPYVPGTHFYNNFGHLNGYSSNYYIYQWSKAIATDLMSRFRTAGLRNTDVAQAYRAKVLGSAGSRPADEMLKDFLGRPFSTAAYKKYLDTLH